MQAEPANEANARTSPRTDAARVLHLPYAFEATVLGRRCRNGRSVTVRDHVPVAIRHVEASHAPVAVRLRHRVDSRTGADGQARADIAWRRFDGRLFRRLGGMAAVTAERFETDLRQDGASGGNPCDPPGWDPRDYPVRSLPTDRSPEHPAHLLPTLQTLSLPPLRGPFREQDSDRSVRLGRAVAYLTEALLIVDGEIWISPSWDCEPYWMIVADRFDGCVRVELRCRAPAIGEGSHRFSVERLQTASAHAAALSKAWGVPDWQVTCDHDVVQIDPDVAVDDVRICALDALAAVDAAAQAEVEGRWGGDAVEAFARLVVLQRTLPAPSPSDVVRILQAFLMVAEGSKRRMAMGSAASRMAALAHDVSWRWTLTECSERPDLAALWPLVAREEAATVAADAAALATLAP